MQKKTTLSLLDKEGQISEEQKHLDDQLAQYRHKYLSTRYMDLRCDWAFKHITRNLDILKMLIEDILDESISEISHLPNEVDRFLGKEKDVTMDVLCKDAMGREFIVEVQQRKTLSFRDRIFYYGASMIHAQVARGGDYGDMRPVYVICIVDYASDHEDDQLVYRYSLCEVSSGEQYGSQLTICVCELPRLKKKLLGEMNNLEVWLHLFNKMFTFAEEPEGLPARFAPVLDAAQMRGLQEGEQKQYLQAMISQREREDIGGAYYLDGRKDALLETAHKMQEMGFSSEQIKQVTGIEL